ncbi:MAG: restriction endonuclease [Candidatus Entotheonellia bacterium]
MKSYTQNSHGRNFQISSYARCEDEEIDILNGLLLEVGFKFPDLWDSKFRRPFRISNLAPLEPFRIVGEQVDGSFELDHETYIVEAKWKKCPLPEADLLVLRSKIEGRSAYTRGVFIALNGITDQAKQAIIRGKQPNFFIIDGYDLVMVLSEQTTLVELLRQKQRILAEEGLVFVPYSELSYGSRGRLASAMSS